MNEQEQFLTEVLQKTATIINIVDEKYHQAAFPIILKALINESTAVSPKTLSRQSNTLNKADILQLSSSMSVNEFFRRVSPSSHPARFVCSAYYLLHTGKGEAFTQADILEIYGKLREPKPKNFTDVVNQCIRKVHIIDASSSTNKQKAWAITTNGEKYVEELINDNTNNK